MKCNILELQEVNVYRQAEIRKVRKENKARQKKRWNIDLSHGTNYIFFVFLCNIIFVSHAKSKDFLKSKVEQFIHYKESMYNFT